MEVNFRIRDQLNRQGLAFAADVARPQAERFVPVSPTADVRADTDRMDVNTQQHKVSLRTRTSINPCAADFAPYLEQRLVMIGNDQAQRTRFVENVCGSVTYQLDDPEGNVHQNHNVILATYVGNKDTTDWIKVLLNVIVLLRPTCVPAERWAKYKVHTIAELTDRFRRRVARWNINAVERSQLMDFADAHARARMFNRSLTSVLQSAVPVRFCPPPFVPLFQLSATLHQFESVQNMARYYTAVADAAGVTDAYRCNNTVPPATNMQVHDLFHPMGLQRANAGQLAVRGVSVFFVHVPDVDATWHARHTETIRNCLNAMFNVDAITAHRDNLPNADPQPVTVPAALDHRQTTFRAFVPFAWRTQDVQFGLRQVLMFMDPCYGPTAWFSCRDPPGVPAPPVATDRFALCFLYGPLHYTQMYSMGESMYPGSRTQRLVTCRVRSAKNRFLRSKNTLLHDLAFAQSYTPHGSDGQDVHLQITDTLEQRSMMATRAVWDTVLDGHRATHAVTLV